MLSTRYHTAFIDAIPSMGENIDRSVSPAHVSALPSLHEAVDDDSFFHSDSWSDAGTNDFTDDGMGLLPVIPSFLDVCFTYTNPAAVPIADVQLGGERIASAIVFSTTPAVNDGATAAVLHASLRFTIPAVFGIHRNTQFIHTLEDNVTERGIPYMAAR